MLRLIVSGTLSFPEMSSWSLVSRLNSSNFVSVTSRSPRLIFITLIKSAVSPCASLLPYLNTRLRYASYPFCSGTSRTIFLGPFFVSSARILPASSVGVRFTLGSAATAPSAVCRPSLPRSKSAQSPSRCTLLQHH